MKKILIATTFNNHFRFFKRLAAALSNQGYTSHFLTNRQSIVNEAGADEKNLFTLKWNSSAKPVKFDLSNTFELAAGLISPNKAQNLAASVYAEVKQLHSRNSYDIIFMWSGVRLIEFVINNYAKENSIKTLFFELGNFPKKIFVDPKGTNAKSLLADDKTVLSGFDLDGKSYKNWREQYISSSLSKHQVPQSSSAGSVDYKKNLLDIIGFRSKGLLQYEPLITKEKLIGKYLRKSIKIEYEEFNLPEENYIFLPMQVNKDAQLILNSNVGNLDAIEIAAENARENDLKLFVKPHPAEVEVGFLSKLHELKNELNFHFVNANTIELIKYSKEVVTINSTVGLQAKLLEKQVTCLGNAFYSEFTQEELAKYIQSYLIDVEFWDDSEIDNSIAEKIITRSELN